MDLSRAGIIGLAVVKNRFGYVNVSFRLYCGSEASRSVCLRATCNGKHQKYLPMVARHGSHTLTLCSVRIHGDDIGSPIAETDWTTRCPSELVTSGMEFEALAISSFKSPPIAFFRAVVFRRSN